MRRLSSSFKVINVVAVLTLVILSVAATSPAFAVVSADPHYVATLLATGLSGPANGVLYRAGTNDVLVTLFRVNKVVKVNASTGAVSDFATVTAPDEMAINSSGHVFVKQHSNGPIWRFDSNGTALNPATFAAPCANPTGIAFDAADNFYVACFFTGEIFKFPAGNFTTASLFATVPMVSGSLGLEGMRFSPAGTLIVADDRGGNIFEISADGSLVSLLISGLEDPLNVAIHPATGQVFATSTDKVVRLAPFGEFLAAFDVATGFTNVGEAGAYALDFDGNGCFYVDDFTAGQLWKLCPVALNDPLEFSYTTTENTPLSIKAPGVLGNDTPNNSTVGAGPVNAVFVGMTGPGSVVLNADGSFTYTPPASFNFGGASSFQTGFTYKAQNPLATSNVAAVSITVTRVNHAPVAFADSYTIDVGTGPLTVSAANGVLANDTDPDNNPLTASQVGFGSAHGGGVSLAADGSFVYTPPVNFAGTDSFTYQASDGTATSGVTLVSIKVNDPNAQKATVTTFNTTCDITLNLKFEPAQNDTFVIRPIDFYKHWHCRLFKLPGDIEIEPKSIHGAPGITLQISGDPLEGDLFLLKAGQSASFDARGNLCALFDVTDGDYRAECTAENSITDPTADPGGGCSGTECLGAPIRTYVEKTEQLLFTSSNGVIVTADADQCPGLTGNAAATGCPFAIDLLVTLNRTPLSGVQVRVFDRDSPAFQQWTNGEKNPPSSRYPDIYESRQGEITSCITDAQGGCKIGLTTKAQALLLLVKFTNPTTQQADYAGAPGSSSDFKGNSTVATKEINIRR